MARAWTVGTVARLLSGRVGKGPVHRVRKIAGGKTGTVNVRLKFKNPDWVKATFKVRPKNAGGKTVSKKIRVGG